MVKKRRCGLLKITCRRQRQIARDIAETQHHLARSRLRCIQSHRRTRRVMRCDLPGAGNGVAAGRTGHLSQDTAHRFRWHPAGTQQQGIRAKPHDRTFQTDRAGPVIQHRRNPAIQPCQNVRGTRRANASGGVRGGCRDRAAESLQQSAGRRMRRHPDCHGVEPCGDERCQPVPFFQRQHQRQRTGPESLCKRRCGIVPDRQLPRSGGIRHMHNQRVEGRPPLGRIYRRNCRAVAGIRAKAVNRFGRKGDKSAGL